MPSMPWTAVDRFERDRDYLVMATRATIAGRRHLPAIIASTRTLWAGLCSTDGLLGYSMRPDLIHATLATLTVWQDRAALSAFVQGEQHAAVIAQTRKWVRSSAFASWSVTGAGLPPQWSTADAHLDAATVTGPQPRGR